MDLSSLIVIMNVGIMLVRFNCCIFLTILYCLDMSVNQKNCKIAFFSSLFKNDKPLGHHHLIKEEEENYKIKNPNPRIPR